MRAQIDAALAVACGSPLVAVGDPVGPAIRYSVLGEGKRLRPILTIAAYHASGGRADPTALAASLEIVHAYSLVHDDLPCMDDDDMRRGRPTTHRAFGEAVATVAGVAMVPFAVRCAWEAATALGLPVATRGAIVRELMRASGAGGMVGGQLRDLGGEGAVGSLEELERVHRGKTGALIVAAVRVGALAAGAMTPAVQALSEYAAAVGLAFQIADDVLDATSTAGALGKTAGIDAARGKRTYVDYLGVTGAMTRAGALREEACRALRRAGLLTPMLERLARYAVERAS